MTVAIYARVSSESQEARGTIGSQLEALRRKMAELGQQVVHEYIDDGYSGARLDRPGLDALRDAAEDDQLPRHPAGHREYIRPRRRAHRESPRRLRGPLHAVVEGAQ